MAEQPTEEPDGLPVRVRVISDRTRLVRHHGTRRQSASIGTALILSPNGSVC